MTINSSYNGSNGSTKITGVLSGIFHSKQSQEMTSKEHADKITEAFRLKDMRSECLTELGHQGIKISMAHKEGRESEIRKLQDCSFELHKTINEINRKLNRIVESAPEIGKIVRP